MINKPITGKKIGLALGSGSARGWAHIGVIEALGQLGIKPHYIAGTSMGALVGAFYAADKLGALKNLSLTLDWKQIVSFLDVVLPKAGLIDGQKITDFIHSNVGDIKIEDLEIPLGCVATDLSTAEEVVISSGDMIEAVRSSISLPGIFTPVSRNGQLLVDGGLVNPVPVSVLKQMGAEYIIAVDLNHDISSRRIIAAPKKEEPQAAPKEPDGEDTLWRRLGREISAMEIPLPAQFSKWFADDNLPSIIEVMMKSLDILEIQVASARLRLDPPDILIRPSLGHMRLIEFDRAQEAIDAGYSETMKTFRG